jgi:MtN3 and saliva related transmembrane protein
VLIFSALGLVLSSVILVLKVRGSRTQPDSGDCRQERPPQRASDSAEAVAG